MKKGIFLIFTLIVCPLIALLAYAEGQAGGPGVVKLDSISDKYGAVRFDHAKHTALAGDCGMCHHQHGTNGALPCKDCHSLSPANFKNSAVHSFMACKNCHSAYDPSNPGMPGLKTAYHIQCFKCHRGMAGIGEDPKGCAGMCHAKREQKPNKRGNQ